MSVHPMAGKPASASMLIDVSRLIDAYFSERPDAAVPSQRVAFGTSGHRGSSFARSFNEWHWLAITQARANDVPESAVEGVMRLPLDAALHAPTTHRHNYLEAYVADLGNVIDMDSIRASGIQLGVDPLGGAGVHYWGAIAERYRLNLTVVNDAVDPAFRFMTVDWDGKIRMDPSSPYAMQSLIGLKDKFDVAFACDTDHDRHGIVAASVGLVPPNHYFSVAIQHLFQHRQRWPANARVGK